MDGFSYQRLTLLCCLVSFILVTFSRGEKSEVSQRMRRATKTNQIDLRKAVLCRMGRGKDDLRTCWSNQGCYVRQMYNATTKATIMILYDCIRSTGFPLFTICGMNYRKDRPTVFHYGMRVRNLSYCCGTTLCNNVKPTIPNENWIN